MQSVPNARDKIKVADVVVSTNHVTFLTNRIPSLISLPTSAIFVSGTSGVTAILKYRSVNPIYIYIYIYSIQLFPSSLFSMRFVTIYVVHPYSSTDTDTAWKNPVLFYRIDQTFIWLLRDQVTRVGVGPAKRS